MERKEPEVAGQGKESWESPAGCREGVLDGAEAPEPGSWGGGELAGAHGGERASSSGPGGGRFEACGRGAVPGGR